MPPGLQCTAAVSIAACRSRERRHVAHRIVHEHVIELAIQPQRAHVAGDVLGFRIDRAALRQHAFREIGQRQLELLLEVRREAAAAAPSSSSVAVPGGGNGASRRKRSSASST